jgi:hypothetical protein
MGGAATPSFFGRRLIAADIWRLRAVPKIGVVPRESSLHP